MTVFETDAPSASDSSSAATTATSEPVSTPDTHTSSSGWVAGAVIGPVAFVALTVIALFLLRRRRKRRPDGERGLSPSGQGRLYAKPELPADDIKQTAPAELDGENDSQKELVELPGTHHDCASELPGYDKEEKDDGQRGSNAGGSKPEENTKLDGAPGMENSPVSAREHIGDR